MSAHEQMRAMLDQLMGTGRDGMFTFPNHVSEWQRFLDFSWK